MIHLAEYKSPKYTDSMRLGIFDSGIGGEAIARPLKTAFPTADILIVNDRKNLPYGNKSPDEVRVLTDQSIRPLLGRDIIVIACNTATTLALPYLRAKYPQQKFIGIEPMIKPASILTRAGTICVCATPATLASKRYSELVLQFASKCQIIEPDCSRWASMIERNTLTEQHIKDAILPVLEAGADIIVLGCTHYHWIRQSIIDLVGDQASVIDPSEAIVDRVRYLLEL